MSAPVFLWSDLAAATPGAKLLVSGDEGRHGASVRRLRTGEIVDLVDGNGRRVTGTVGQVFAKEFQVVATTVVDEPAPKLLVTVVQALAKGDRAESAVEMLTECGVDRIVPWAAERSISVWRGEKQQRGVARWAAVARAAAKQSRRSRVPAIGALADTDQVAALLAAADLGLVLHEDATTPLSRCEVPERGEVTLVVGPEGGISDRELAGFEATGAVPVRLGDTVLRTSTAGVVATGVLSAMGGRWD